MNWNWLIRQLHRWLSITFTLGVGAYIIAMGQGRPPPWFGLLALLPLIFLLVTGLYLFVRPYVSRRRSGAAVKGPQALRSSAGAS